MRGDGGGETSIINFITCMIYLIFVKKIVDNNCSCNYLPVHLMFNCLIFHVNC
jgi:hypothetical protein